MKKVTMIKRLIKDVEKSKKELLNPLTLLALNADDCTNKELLITLEDKIMDIEADENYISNLLGILGDLNSDYDKAIASTKRALESKNIKVPVEPKEEPEKSQKSNKKTNTTKKATKTKAETKAKAEPKKEDAYKKLRKLDQERIKALKEMTVGKEFICHTSIVKFDPLGDVEIDMSPLDDMTMKLLDVSRDTIYAKCIASADTEMLGFSINKPRQDFVKGFKSTQTLCNEEGTELGRVTYKFTFSSM